MKADWKQIRRGDVDTRTAGYYATMNRKGVIMFNKTTHDRMDQPEAVHLLYDPVNNRIGLKPTGRSMSDAYPLERRKGRTGRYVHAMKLLREVGIELPETIEFRGVEIDQDGILILDLRNTHVSPRAGGWARGRAGRENERKRRTEVTDATE
jgi:hypothetical protein